MNIAYTHKFTDPEAKSQAIRQNLEHMVYLMWHDNVPSPMAESVVWQDIAQDEITNWLDSRLEFPSVPGISDFVSKLIERSHESYEDAHV